MKPCSILLIHGFGGGLWELAPLQADLTRLGYHCRSFTLPGHDSNGKIQGIHSVETFGAAALKEYKQLAKQGLPIIIVGFSMGAFLAAWLATVQKPKKLVLINTPILIGRADGVVHWIREDCRSKSFEHSLKMLKNAMRQGWNLNFLFLKVRRRFLPSLRYVQIPVFLAQSQWDETVQPRSVFKAAEILKREKIMLRIYDNSPHHLCESSDYPRFFKDLCLFLAEASETVS